MSITDVIGVRVPRVSQAKVTATVAHRFGSHSNIVFESFYLMAEIFWKIGVDIVALVGVTHMVQSI